ncbi:fasciclin domain-containing protein [Blastomonas sp. AAP53]|uniref:fasciclin domain-containing protein n=1 Tax=Blastomonas sp. AAP53 TaxID=1248760 RepID=UPI000301EC53|nr:fasciclin domain-containing protein [Blastomonas sp. AAP53]
MRFTATVPLLGLALALSACGSQDGGGDPVKRVDAASLDAQDAAAADVDAILRVDEVVLRNPDLSTLARAIKAADLNAALAAETPMTLFAPDNGGFDKLGVDTLAELLLPENKGRLAMVLNYHVIPGRLSVADMRKQIADKGGSVEIETLEGERLNVSIELDQLRLSDASGNVGSVTTGDLKASNGMVHVIETVLSPQERATQGAARPAATASQPAVTPAE